MKIWHRSIQSVSAILCIWVYFRHTDGHLSWCKRPYSCLGGRRQFYWLVGRVACTMREGRWTNFCRGGREVADRLIYLISWGTGFGIRRLGCDRFFILRLSALEPWILLRCWVPILPRWWFWVRWPRRSSFYGWRRIWGCLICRRRLLLRLLCCRSWREYCCRGCFTCRGLFLGGRSCRRCFWRWGVLLWRL